MATAVLSDVKDLPLPICAWMFLGPHKAYIRWEGKTDANPQQKTASFPHFLPAGCSISPSIIISNLKFIMLRLQPESAAENLDGIQTSMARS